MALFEGFNANDLERWKQIVELQNKSSSSLSSYYETMKAIRDIEASLKHLLKQRKKVEDTITDLTEKAAEIRRTDARYMESKTYQALLKQIKLEKVNLRYAEEGIRLAREKTKYLSEALNTTNLLVASTKSLGKSLRTVGVHLAAQTGYLLDQQKAVKSTELTMGILSKQAAAFRDNLYKASQSTNALGVDTKELALMQGTYSEEMGRSVQLTEQGLVAMTQLAKGTTLGAEGAAQLASEMDNFNISVTSSRDIVEDMLNSAHRMGVNATKVTANLRNNLKLAQKYQFKDGVKGLTKMAVIATKFKLDMQSVTGFAEQLFNPEGAVDMAAKLQVLGGSWAKLGDPFELMFKARNDMEGLTKEIVEATKGTAQFNKETGEFQLATIELQRLREVANATGLPFEELSQAAREAAKYSKIRAEITGNYDKDDKDFIESLAVFNSKTKKFEVNIDGEGIALDQLHKLNKDKIKQLKDEKATLEKRALQAQTFDQTWGNIVNTFKTALLPGFESFSTALSQGLGDFQGWMKENKVIERLADIGKTLGGVAASLLKFIADNPIKSMIGGLTLLLAKESAWILRGRLLGMGFNSVANGGGKGLIDGISPGSGGKGGGVGRFGRPGRLSGGMSFGKSAMKGLKVGGGLGLAALALDAGRSMVDDQESDLAKGIGMASSTAEYAAYGAMLGSIVPGLGTALGGIIGGAIGLGKGYYDEYGSKDEPKPIGGRIHQDFIARPGAEPIPFSSADTLVGLKKDGGLGKALMKNSGSVGGKVEVVFNTPIKIEGTVRLETNDKTAEIDLDNPMVIRALTKLMREELARGIGGGKISANPV